MPGYQEVLIEVKDLSLTIENRLILEHIDLKVHRGEIVTIVGPNGAGKSCLVKCILSLMTPTHAHMMKRPGIQIGYTPQKMHVESTMPLTVERFLRLGQKSKIDVNAVLAEVGVQGLGQNWMYRLSGGELQRVLLARALSHNPDLLVLDEPAQGVDIAGQNEVYRLLSRIRDKRKCGILMVSHDLSLVMAQTDTVICLQQHVCCVGHPAKVAQDPEFRSLFGITADNLGLYTHHHDHHHSVEGEIQAKEEKHD